MPKSVFDKLQHAKIIPTSMCLQLADQSLCYLIGIVEDIPVNIRGFFIPVDFVVLEKHPDSKVSLILGRPFLSMANVHINVELEKSTSTLMDERNASHLDRDLS
jgi:hypothetical protein